jgi:signal transduction histidine kinase
MLINLWFANPILEISTRNLEDPLIDFISQMYNTIRLFLIPYQIQELWWRMARSAGRLPQWIFFLAASFMFGAVFLRTVLIYRDSPELSQAIGLLLAFLILSASESVISHKWKGYFWIYLVLQTSLVFLLLTFPEFPDFFAILFSILSMQVMLRLTPKIGGVWIGLCALIMLPILARIYQTQAVALTLIYTAASVFLGSYTLAVRRAQEARLRNQALARQLRADNQELQAYSAKLEGMAVARERNRLARELHDSVTQTVFSMNLTTQSALLLYNRDPGQVGPQLVRLSQLAQSALSEMQLLISELPPEKVAAGGLVSALHRHLQDSHFPESLSVSLEVEGDSPLSSREEQSLLWLTREALNNVVKHSQTLHAQVFLHLTEPYWIEIQDQGQGFDLKQAQNSNRVGLMSMRERAAEIGWDLQVITSPGAGTRIRVEKAPEREVRV